MMRAADKRRYERLKAEKRCVRCGAQDERTKAGRTLCKGCYEYDSKKAKLQYKERCKNQCCIQCGAQDSYTLKGHTRCLNCAIKNGVSVNKWYKKKTAQSGTPETV
jgi:hypothetical protein